MQVCRLAATSKDFPHVPRLTPRLAPRLAPRLGLTPEANMRFGRLKPCMSLHRKAEADRHRDGDLAARKDHWWRRKLRALRERKRLLVERRRPGAGHEAG